MPASVAATGSWRSETSTYSSQSDVKVFSVSIMDLPGRASAGTARRTCGVRRRSFQPQAPGVATPEACCSHCDVRSADADDVGGLLALLAGRHVELDAV